MKVRRFQETDREPIAHLNARLKAGGATDVVYPEGVEQKRHESVRERLFVAEDDGEIRGGVWLREQGFRVRGQDVSGGWLKYPVAESLVNTKYSGIPASLIIQCLREQPRLLALGLGGHAPPLPRMLKALKWTGMTVPAFVKLVRPARVLRQVEILRRSRGRRAAAALLALSGLGWLGVRAYELGARLRGGRVSGRYEGQPCDRLGDWAQELWARVRDEYAFAAARDVATAETLIPRSPDVQRLRVTHDGADVGWFYVVRHDFSSGAPDRAFGRLTVGMIADVFASPRHARGVVQVAVRHLRSRGVDVIVSNQLHPAWTDALKAVGFLEAPSNFAFYAAPQIASQIDWAACHVTRGDCDGPMWYEGREG
jgi:hypothetical protein